MSLFNKDEEKKNSSIFHVVAVKDELTGTFLQPTFGDNLDALMRIFKTQINTLPIWKDNPTDFSLYKLGTFNQETGLLSPEYQKLMSGHTVIERKEQNE